jgi:serine/threonine protein kinase
LLTLDNPSIPRIYGIYDIKIHGEIGLGMLLDYKEGTDLSSWIPATGFPEWAMKGVVTQIRDVLLYLHRRCIVHRDIKPSNVLVERGNDGYAKVCLADFGLAAQGEERARLAIRCGSPGFVAPELFQPEWADAVSSPGANSFVTSENVLKTDVFSFGMLIYAAALGVNPFVCPTLRESYKKNARGVIEAGAISQLSAALQDLLTDLTERDPRNRCSIIEAASHPWFRTDLRALGFAGADEATRGDSVSWELFVQESRRQQD